MFSFKFLATFLTAVLSTLIISLPLSFLGPLTNLSPVYDSHFLASSYNSVQFSHVRLFATPWTAARQASLSIPNSRSLLRLMCIESGCHPTISSSVVPFSSCLQSFPASGSFPMSQLFASGGQSIAVSASASVLPINIQDWFPLGLTGFIFL